MLRTDLLVTLFIWHNCLSRGARKFWQRRGGAHKCLFKSTCDDGISCRSQIATVHFKLVSKHYKHQNPRCKIGKNIPTLLMFIAGYSTKVFSQCHYRNFLLGIEVNAIEQVFAIANTRNSHNGYTKYLIYCIYLYSQLEIPV